MKNNYLLLFCLTFLFALQSNAQDTRNGWIFGAGYNIVDDSGTRGNEPFNIGDNWNSNFYPNRFMAGYETVSGFTFQGIFSLNTYKEGNIIDGTEITEDQNYYAADGLITYGLNKFFAQRGWFDPYLALGGGISSINKNEMFTFNAGGGVNFWVGENFAINLNTLGKWGLGDDSGLNHIQHSLGVVFRPNIFKKKAKPAPMPEPAPEPVKEEVAPVAPPAPVVEEPAVPQKTEAEILREKMAQELADIPRVYYAFDSSYMTEQDKQTVDNLVGFMEKYPNAILEVQAHADSRGTEQYNLWLSERRAKRIVDYAISKGIDANRLRPIGFGENKLVNRCTEGTPCTAEQHRENRRTEYVLVWE
ncbi:OmpA family protein [Robertkochia sediminum]|uniref:OmpA family protein n=1 Tax=Robertkochia sediminum TaxID=2785326 RepID=UPI00193394C9|nr:OmpA family protein [Robertkochia sediminum]MBL7472177.1 OmpA family protein [Robertkochia sediminum]